MHFVVAVLCASALWAMLAMFTVRLWQAIASGKSWSRRRFTGCIYAYTLSIIQVRAHRHPAAIPPEMQLRAIPPEPDLDQTSTAESPAPRCDLT